MDDTKQGQFLNGVSISQTNSSLVECDTRSVFK